MALADDLENQLLELGETLRSQPSIADRVMQSVGASPDQISDAAMTRSVPGPKAFWRRMSLLAAAGTLAVAWLAIVAFWPAPSLAWAQVQSRLLKQPWIRGSCSFDGQESTVFWYSPQQKIWARRSPHSFQLLSETQMAKFEFSQGARAIVQLPLEAFEMQRLLPMEQFAEKANVLGPWLFGEKLVNQHHAEVVEEGRRWVDFQLTFWRGVYKYGVLRVDPVAKLPVSLSLSSSAGGPPKYVWRFDYPDEGPTDIYALGVPRDTPVDNRVPENDAMRVLQAMAATRSKLGDFQMAAAIDRGSFEYMTAARKGAKWRIDSLMSFRDPLAKPAAEEKLSAWIAEQREQGRLNVTRSTVCTGTAVFERLAGRQPQRLPPWNAASRLAPQDFMSPNSSSLLSVNLVAWLYPDLTPRSGWEFEFDARPAEMPGCVLIKRSARLATATPMVGHEWYYIDPARGHAVVRAELFNLAADQVADPEAATMRQTLRMSDFEQSPDDFWYARRIEESASVIKGGEWMQPPKAPDDGETRVSQTASYTYRVEMDFQTPVSDAPFDVSNE